MARTTKKDKEPKAARPAPVFDQPITATLRENYMPYAMSSIISRAIPEIDGLKPSHRKLLYTMYRIGLLNGPLTKSTAVVGETMKLNPHGDAAIYDTLVRLTRGHEALLHPPVESKGSFGKQYSRVKEAADRYTEVKLAPICAEIFSGIEKDAVDMVDSYDGKLKEPALLPTSFPNILVSPNLGIAVGLASQICSFNLGEVCDAMIALIRDPNADLYPILKGPDFSTGADLLYDPEEIRQIYETGRGSFTLRSVWHLEPKENRIVVTEIPYTTTAEQIIDKILQLIKEGKLREISDVRNEIDITGLKIAIDYKRGSDPDKLMAKLLRVTDLECRFPCNFNVLIAGTPYLLGVRDLLNEWFAFRCECVKREIFFDVTQKKDKLHLLQGLEKILVDIDKAIAIIRRTENEKDVVPNLMRGFSIDQVQAEYICEIKLRHLNREYILNRTSEKEKLEQEIAELESILNSQKKLDAYIIRQLTEIKKKYAIPRKTRIVTDYEHTANVLLSAEKEEYRAFAVMTAEGYLKNIPLKSIQMFSEHKLKENDRIIFEGELSSKAELLFFTDKAQVYKARFEDFATTKASELGDYVPAKLEMEKDEKVVYSCPAGDYKEKLVIGFANGKGVIIPLSAYETKSNRKKLTAAFNGNSPVVAMFRLAPKEICELFFKTKSGRGCILRTTLIPEKTTRSSQGVQLVALKKTDSIVSCEKVDTAEDESLVPFKKLRVPTPGVPLK